MARKWLACTALAFLLSGCGGVSLCDCEAEAKKENPAVELMEECAALYEGKTYEEIEVALEECE